MSMRLITAMEIASNERLIQAYQNAAGKWGSTLYMMRDGNIHKAWCSYNDFPFDTEADARAAMQQVIDDAEAACAQTVPAVGDKGF